MGYMLKNGKKYRAEIKPIHKQFTLAQTLSPRSRRVIEIVRKRTA